MRVKSLQNQKKSTAFTYTHNCLVASRDSLYPSRPKNKEKNHSRKRTMQRTKGKNGKTPKRWDDEERLFWNCRESTAKGMFSWSGLHLLRWGGCGLYIIALNTAETVGMYAVLLRASSHVSPISWQSLLIILVPLSVVVFLFPPLTFSCNPSIKKIWNKKKNKIYWFINIMGEKDCVWKWRVSECCSALGLYEKRKFLKKHISNCLQPKRIAKEKQQCACVCLFQHKP